MMGKEILLVAEIVSNEREIDKAVVFQAMEEALAVATESRQAKRPCTVRVSIDQETGDYSTFRSWKIVSDDHESIDIGLEIAHSELPDTEASLSIGDQYEKQIDNLSFGRIEAQIAKQIVIKKMRAAERLKIINRYKHDLGALLTGVVKRVTRDNIIIDFGNMAEGLLPRAEMMMKKNCRVGDHVRTVLVGVSEDERGPQLFLSRTDPRMLESLLRIEVPEISEDIVSIMGVARDPGVRAKVCVKTNDGRVDPVGACIGMRGARIQAVSNELCNERIDVILWDENPAQLVINAMAPVEVSAVVVDEEAHAIEVAVSQENYAQSVGRNGQNVVLASQLTGWKIQIKTEEEAVQKRIEEREKIEQLFRESLSASDEIIQALADSGFMSIEEIAYVPVEELLEIGLEEVACTELQLKAKDALLMRAISEEKAVVEATQELNTVIEEEQQAALVPKLIQNGILTREALAELAVDELLELVDLTQEEASQLIMSARQPWFQASK